MHKAGADGADEIRVFTGKQNGVSFLDACVPSSLLLAIAL